MDRESLILRFRNYVNGVLGTDEHLRLIKQYGSAWWGWWKRADEPDRRESLEKLSYPLIAVLISPSEEVQFSARVKQVRFGQTPDRDRIPPYYIEEAAKIPAWFELTNIERVNFNKDLASILSRTSLTLLTPNDVREIGRSGPTATHNIESDHSHVLHISDVHIGKDHNFAISGEETSSNPEPQKPNKRISLVEAIKRDLDRIGAPDIAAIVVSGDLVSRSEWDHKQVLKFFSDLSDVLNVEKRSILFVPGNHDFYRQDEKPRDLAAVTYQHEMSYRGFWAEFHNIKPFQDINGITRIQFKKKKYDLVFGLLNSARWTSVPGFFEYGFVGKEKYRYVLDDMKRLNDKPCVRALVLHHHLVPIQPFEQPGESPTRPVSITLDATEIVCDAQESGISLVLHGHQHLPDIVKISRLRQLLKESHGVHDEDIFICSAGSCGSRELPLHQWNTYSLFEFGDEEIDFRVRILDPLDNQVGDYTQMKLPIKPA